MSLDSDVIVDRRRMRRKLTFWRVAAVVVAIAAIVAVGVLATPGGRQAFAVSGSIARVNIEGLIRSDQRAERFAVGEKVDARVIQFDKKARKVQVSIKALEVAEEKEAIAQYGSSDSGATLGDILGTALKGRVEK